MHRWWSLTVMYSLSNGGGESASNLEGIIDDPLEASKGTNHEDSGTKTLPESGESNLGVDLLNLRPGGATSSSLVEDGDHGISWVRNDGAENTSDVTGHEGNGKLSSLGVGGFLLGEDLSVELGNDLLESDELDNGVWNLSSPEWLKTLVESVDSLGRVDGVESLDGTGWESSFVSSLHSNLKLNH